MDIETAKTNLHAAQAHLIEAQTLIDAALTDLDDDAVPPDVLIIATPADLDAAIAAAAPGAVLTLAPTLVYPDPLTLSHAVTLEVADTLPAGRIAADVPLPAFLGGVVLAGDDVTIRGAEIRHAAAAAYDIVQIRGARTTLDRVRVLGDPGVGDKRGIAANGNGDCVIRDCIVDDCFGPYPGNDTQAIAAWDMAPGLLIDNCFLRGGSETILIGGADAPTDDRMPADILITNCDITKRPDWQPQAVGVKNTIELKVGRRVRIEHNRISQSWGGHGQTGFLLVLSVRNQDGGAVWSTIEDVTIRENEWSCGAAAINVLGRDNNHPSGQLTRVRIADNTFTDLDSRAYTGDSRMILCGGGSHDLHICDNDFAAANVSSVVYFYGDVPANLHDGMVLTGNVFPPSAYGIFGEGASVGKPGQIPPAWTRYVTNGTLDGNVVAGATTDR